MVVVERETPNRFGDRKYLAFEPLTLVPFQQKFIDLALLTPGEVAYVNAYHARIRHEIEPLLCHDDMEARAWLDRATSPLPFVKPDDVACRAAEVHTAANIAVGSG